MKAMVFAVLLTFAAALAALAQTPGTVKTNPKDGLKYVWIPPGTFMMGCSPGDNQCFDDEKPPHEVIISKGFWMGQTEVTVAAYKRFVAATGRKMPPEPSYDHKPLNPGWGGQAMPMADVTWDEAQAYCRWEGGRLPKEAEWEYAGRGGSTRARYGDLDEIAWYADNSGRQHLDSARILREDLTHYGKCLNENGDGIHDVGLKRANRFRLYDMLGNVAEWVYDWYAPNFYQNSPPEDPFGPMSGEERVQRGASWYVNPWGVRISKRGEYSPDERGSNCGFRCAREVNLP